MSSQPTVSNLFQNPDGICCPDAYSAAGIPPDPKSIANVVAIKGSIGVPTLRGQYGHTITPAVALKHSEHQGTSRLYLTQPDQALVVARQDFETWNKEVPTMQSRMTTLRTTPVGGILAVFRHWDATTNTFGIPVLRMVAAPVVASTSSDNYASHEIDPSDIWDPLPPALDNLNLSSGIIPMMVSSGGFTRHLKKPSVADLLHEARPLIIPSAVQFATPVTTPDDQRHHHHLLFPEGSNLPIGMIWKLNPGIAVEDIITSILEVSQRAFPTLLSLLELPLVETWIAAVSTQPDLFVTNTIPYDQVESFYPSLESNEMPISIACPHSLAPWIDMRYLFIWRLTLDRIRSQPNPELATTMHRYIQHATTALHASTYAGNISSADMFPNMIYHFQPHNGWPGIPPPILLQLASDHMVSIEARQYASILVDIHSENPPALPLLTTERRKVYEQHREDTPQYDVAQAIASHQSTPRQTPTQLIQQQTPGTRNAPYSILDESTPTKLRDATSFQRQSQFSPAPSAHSTVQPLTTPLPTHHKESSANRSLFHNHPVDSPKHAPPNPSIPGKSASTPKWASLSTWDLSSASNRKNCEKSYVLACFLLIHRAPSPAPTTAYVAPESSSLYLRNASSAFRREILQPMHISGHTHQVIDYLEHIADQCQYSQFRHTYSSQFLASSNLKVLYRLQSWDMDPHFNPRLTDASSWTVYSWISCLRTREQHPARIPTAGIQLTEMKYILQFAYIWFRSMDSKSRSEVSPFTASLLGRRLSLLQTTLKDPAVDELWRDDPKSMTFWAFDSLRSMLFPYQSLAQYAAWEPQYSIEPNSSSIIVHPTVKESGNFNNLQQAADDTFRARWNMSSIRSIKNFQQDVLPDHFVGLKQPPTRPTARLPSHTPNYDQAPPLKRARAPSRPPAQPSQRQSSGPPDYFPSEHIFELINPGHSRLTPQAVVKKLREKIPPGYRMFKLPDDTGKFRLVCLHSACQAPYNQCHLPSCNYKPRNTPDPSPISYLHIDLSQPQWRNKPEEYWNDIVRYFKLPENQEVVQPSAAFKALTPGAQW